MAKTATVNVNLADLDEVKALLNEPRLGCATTAELLEELAVRMEVSQNSIRGCELESLCRQALENLDGYVLRYRTID